ncbi:BON domain-containing protein [Tunturiibacter lichenicola]|uniref:BON domain-containing protein n=1 Tax=Tunturiibacter lichenicola TaxID=2051959 RepID=UPI003D9ADB12
MATVLSAMLALDVSAGFAQTKPAPVPDAQIEASVLKALAGAPELADQAITSTTVYGVVTLNGTVRDEPSRDLAEHLVSTTAGVQKVIDQLVIGAVPAASNDSADGGTNPNLQSDGSIAPADGQSQQPQTSSNPTAAPLGGAPQQQSQYPPAYGSQQQPSGQYPPAYGEPSQGGQYPSPQTGQYPPPYGAPQQPYPPQYGQQRPYVAQKGGDAVVVPVGSTLRVRINQGMDSKKTVVGTPFDGVVLNDIVAGGSIAIPRGASITGTVVEAHTAGELKGKGELKLQLTSVALGGKVYPIATDFWWHQGADKTANTVGNTVGLGAVGALIGAVAGGGVGAAVGAGVGGVAGLGVSAASGKGEAVLPSEAIVVFHLTQPADVTTVSQAELDRLGAGVPVGADPQMQRRYPPPPPPGYYGPVYRPY